MNTVALKIKKAAILLLSAALCTAVTAEAYNMRENFESYEAGSGRCGFDSCSGTVSGDESNKYLLLSPGTSAEKYTDSCKGSVNVSVRFMQTAKVSGRLLMLWNSGKTARSNLMWIVDNSLVLAMDNGRSDADRKLCGLTANKWYSVKISLDFDNQKITQIYVDDAPMLSEPVAMYTTTADVDDLGSIYFANEGNSGNLCIDDLSVTSILHPDIEAAAAEAKKCLAETEGTETGRYPHSSFTMLKDVIDKYEDAVNSENLTDKECSAIIDEINKAAQSFRDSVIMGEEAVVYENGFENLSEGSAPRGFLVASNALIAAQHGGKAVRLNGNSRLLYRHSEALTGSYRVSMSFMQERKGAVEYLLDTSDTDGKAHGAWLKADGNDIVAVTDNGNIPVISDYEANVWYDLQCILSTWDKQFTVFVKTSEDEEYTEKGTFGFSGNMISMGRLFNTQIIVSGSSVYIDDLKCTTYPGEYENRVNSVSISGDTIVEFGESAALVTEVYDKDYNLWGDQSVELSVVSGSAEIKGRSVTAGEGYSGAVKIKAAAPEGIYDYAEITFLPERKFEQLSAEEKNGVLTVTGNYPVLKYTGGTVTASLTGEDISMPAECAAKNDGSFTAEFSIPDSVKTQLLTVTVYDDGRKAERSVTYKHYGADAEALFISLFNSEENTQDIIDEYAPVLGIKTNFAYASHKSEYCALLKKGGDVKNIDELRGRVDEANLILGVRYASRDTIQSVFENGKELLSANGYDDAVKSLTQSQKESMYVRIIGYNASSVSDICKKVKEIANGLKSSSSSSSSSSPSYRGGGGGGGTTVVKTPEALPSEDNKTEETAAFKDINEAAWAEQEISRLAKSGALEGYMGYVRPNDSITRAEFAKIIVKMFGAEESESVVFGDVNKSDWYAPYISALAANEIAAGYPDGSFMPNEFITRQDAAVMLARCIDRFNIPVYRKNEDAAFADAESIAPYAAEAVSRLRLCGVINGRGNNAFDPAGIITRAEAAVMTAKLEKFREPSANGGGLTE